MNFSRVISYLFHPLLMPTLAMLILFQADTYFRFGTTIEHRLAILGFLFIMTFLFPFVISLLLLKSKLVSSLEMERTNERVMPLLLTFIFYLGALFIMNEIAISYLIYASFLGATTSVFLVFLIYFLLNWKVSAHMAGLGGVIGAIIAFSIKLSVNMVLALMIFILIAGVVGFARLKLNAHTPGQIYTGFMIGLLTQLLLVL